MSVNEWALDAQTTDLAAHSLPIALITPAYDHQILQGLPAFHPCSGAEAATQRGHCPHPCPRPWLVVRSAYQPQPG